MLDWQRLCNPRFANLSAVLITWNCYTYNLLKYFRNIFLCERCYLANFNFHQNAIWHRDLVFFWFFLLLFAQIKKLPILCVRRNPHNILRLIWDGKKSKNMNRNYMEMIWNKCPLHLATLLPHTCCVWM